MFLCLIAWKQKIVASGLIPRESVDSNPKTKGSKTYAVKMTLSISITTIASFSHLLKCQNHIFIEINYTLIASGTRQLLTNIDKVHIINRNSPRNYHATSSHGFRPQGNTRKSRGNGCRPVQKFCHIYMMISHNTRECWCNGSNIPQAVYGSW